MFFRKLYTLLFIITPIAVYAQLGYSDNWPLGYGSSPDSSYGGSLISFTNGSPEISYFNIQIAYSGENANISDVEGNLIAYTNGCQIQNSQHLLMENGDSINPGINHDLQCSESSGISNNQGAIFLPMPENDSLYYLFHLNTINGTVVKQLLFSVLDRSSANNLGKVISKNQFLEEDTLSGYISAVRHGNGRDWWIIVQKNFNLFNTPLPAGDRGKFHKYLFDPYGVHFCGEQKIGPLWTPQQWSGQACFSADGEKYAIGSKYNGVNLFDFDRCSGDFANPLHLNFNPDSTIAIGVAFSPNSRFLYVATGLLIFQFDLWSNEIESSKQIVAVYDGYQSILPTRFFQLALAPDNKIYGSSTSATNILHIINDPNELGISCNVIQHGLQLPTYHAYTIPNFPQYRLFDVEGSICDSLGINNPTSIFETPKHENQILVYPNPSSGELFFKLDDQENLYIQIFNLVGQKVYGQVLKEPRVNLREIPDGLYLLQIYGLKTNRTMTSKIRILR